jgi:hypothetical protein
MVDRSDVGAVVDEIYAMISGPAGPRDWARQRAIFHPDARQVRTWIGEDGRPAMKIMDPAQYEADTTPFFAANPFYEVEIGRRMDLFGNIAHVWSAYEARRSPDDEAPERRGINSIQLVRDSDGLWSVLAMVWDNEREGVAIGGDFQG